MVCITRHNQRSEVRGQRVRGRRVRCLLTSDLWSLISCSISIGLPLQDAGASRPLDRSSGGACGRVFWEGWRPEAGGQRLGKIALTFSLRPSVYSLVGYGRVN